jgi:hypothetical protein
MEACVPRRTRLVRSRTAHYIPFLALTQTHHLIGSPSTAPTRIPPSGKWSDGAGRRKRRGPCRWLGFTSRDLEDLKAQDVIRGSARLVTRRRASGIGRNCRSRAIWGMISLAVFPQAVDDRRAFLRVVQRWSWECPQPRTSDMWLDTCERRGVPWQKSLAMNSWLVP